jgi:hypothetical protein
MSISELPSDFIDEEMISMDSINLDKAKVVIHQTESCGRIASVT